MHFGVTFVVIRIQLAMLFMVQSAVYVINIDVLILIIAVLILIIAVLSRETFGKKLADAASSVLTLLPTPTHSAVTVARILMIL